MDGRVGRLTTIPVQLMITDIFQVWRLAGTATALTSRHVTGRLQRPHGPCQGSHWRACPTTISDSYKSDRQPLITLFLAFQASFNDILR